MTYPPDVQKALDRAWELGWTTERYQAVLSIALHALDPTVALPRRPEVVVMWAEEDITWTEDTLAPNLRRRVIMAGDYYLVCPVCLRSGIFNYFSDGTKYAYASLEVDPGGDLIMNCGDDREFCADGDSGLTHQGSNCYSRLDMPEWLGWW